MSVPIPTAHRCHVKQPLSTKVFAIETQHQLIDYCCPNLSKKTLFTIIQRKPNSLIKRDIQIQIDGNLL